MSEVFVKNLYYLGPDGSNSHFAAIKAMQCFNFDAENKIPQKSIRQALKSMENDENSFCVLPCENSIEGIVRETVDNMLNISDEAVKIRGEIVLPIKHCLLAKTTDKTKIELIISHPQALAQCSGFLYSNYPNAALQEVSSTSYAAEKASREGNENIAAIANESCAEIYGLKVLENEINDEKGNKTRFFIIGRKAVLPPGSGKTAIILWTKNKPGALFNVLKVFSDYNINLTCIDSRPKKNKPGEYLFYMELDGTMNDERIKNAVNDLESFVEYMKILGSFSSYK